MKNPTLKMTSGVFVIKIPKLMSVSSFLDIEYKIDVGLLQISRWMTSAFNTRPRRTLVLQHPTLKNV